MKHYVIVIGPGGSVHPHTLYHYDVAIKIEDGKVDIIKNNGVFEPAGVDENYTFTPRDPEDGRRGPTMVYRFDKNLLNFLLVEDCQDLFIAFIKNDAAIRYRDFI